MSKLVYPKDGIYRYCDMYFDGAEKYMNKAINNSDFDIPYDFINYNYLNNLNSEIMKCLIKLKTLDKKVKQIDKNYEMLADELERNVRRINSIEIKKRERMIL